MSLTLYNDVSRFVSTAIRTSRFWDSNTDFRFEYRWGYQPVIPKLNQNVPLFFAWIKNMRSKNVTPIEQCEYDSENREYTFKIYQNFELEVGLSHRQQRSTEEYLQPPAFEDQTWDGSLLLAQIVAGMWNSPTTEAVSDSNIGFIRPGMINNESEVVSGRYVREFSISLFFDTIQELTNTAGIIEKIYLEGTESDTGHEFDFILDTPNE